jgi:hypothetical protein
MSWLCLMLYVHSSNGIVDAANCLLVCLTLAHAWFGGSNLLL